MPAYYVPHPALRQVTPPIESEWHRYAIWWEDNRTIRYLVHTDHDCETQCCTETWARYELDGVTIFTETMSLMPGRGLAMSFVFTDPLKADEDKILYQYTSSDGSKSLVLVETTSPAPAPRLSNWEGELERFYQGWIIYANESTPRPLFYTGEDMFRFQWTPDDQYIIIDEYCYGGGAVLTQGVGLMTVRADSLVTHTISSRYNGLCEGSISYRIAPDSQHLIYEPGIVATLNGVEQVRVCDEPERARSYTWSQDGRFVYVSCALSGGDGDTLHRYDTWTGENHVLVNRNCLGFRAIEMTVSPDQTHVAFVWGNTNFMPVEPYGVWIIDLEQLDDCQ